jgi:hypothetical protein
MHHQPEKLPDIIAGPILRRLTHNQLVLWLTGSRPLDITLSVFRYEDGVNLFSGKVDDTSPKPVQIGERAFIYLVHYQPEDPLPENVLLEYDLTIQTDDGEKSITELYPDILYPGQKRPVFCFKPKVDHLLHGSCRRPHHESPDGLLRIDDELQKTVAHADERPAMLIMTGDQIYADDVGGPMLVAIHQAAQLLGLFPEQLDGAVIKDSYELLQSELCYYGRVELLPRNKETKTLGDVFFGGVRKPIFTTASAQNHIITLAEASAMYLLIWSPELWQYINLENAAIPPSQATLYATERKTVEAFAEGLSRARRLLAHIPVYMIFDDHDITDDWNLTRGWEEVAYEHPFSRRIIGNTLIAYFLFQAWGNNPNQFAGEFLEQVHNCFADSGGERQDALINYLLKYEQWNYCLPTSPKMVVLDTRTKRWWSESSLSKPSGLMDWETLSDLQQELMDHPSVFLVSPAPIFGVKLIEVVQRIITFLGFPLVVDAENWMAHPGSANVILNIFRHRKTPKNFVILSGDVHYHFAYDVSLKYRENSPNIWQITCSGFKNEFPHGLLLWFDRINRWLYANHSPLNWFTKRRRMRILPRKPDYFATRQLLDESGTGRVRFNSEGEPTEISVLTASGGEVFFHPK